MRNALTVAQLEHLRGIDTCTVSNAIETFGVRVHNEGFADSFVRAVFRHFPPMVGYAVTGPVRTAATPTVAHSYYDRTDWWNHFLTVPEPRVIVVQALFWERFTPTFCALWDAWAPSVMLLSSSLSESLGLWSAD